MTEEIATELREHIAIVDNGKYNGASIQLVQDRTYTMVEILYP